MKSACRIGLALLASALSFAPLTAFVVPQSATEARQLGKPKPPPVPIPPFRVGDEVEVWINVEWMPGRIVQVGGGPYEDSPFRVAYGIPIGGIQPARWVIPERVRPVATRQPVGQTTGPRPGRYQMLSYGNPANPIRIGHIMVLAGGTYEFYTAADRLIGKGRYAFNPSEQEVVWHDGPLHDQGWGGTFTIERDGKTHKIELKRGTIATNSID